MKMLKNALIILGVLAILSPIILTVTITTVNDYSAAQVEKELQSLPTPESTYVIETLSKAGKLSGNGNGMQYYAAALISSELTLDELKEYYKLYNCKVSIQENTLLETDHYKFHFSEDTFPQNAYVIEKYGHGINEFFIQCDLRGH